MRKSTGANRTENIYSLLFWEIRIDPKLTGVMLLMQLSASLKQRILENASYVLKLYAEFLTKNLN